MKPAPERMAELLDTPAAEALAEEAAAAPPPVEPPAADAAAPPATPAAPAAEAGPSSSASPPPGGGSPSAYRGTFLQEHIKHQTTERGNLQGVNAAANRSYQGIKANVGADSFMMQHMKANRNNGLDASGPLQGVNSPPPGRSYQGVKANVGADSFMMQHLKQQRVGGVSHRPFQGVKANVNADSFLNSETRKAQQQIDHRETKARNLKPHMGADAMMFDFARKQGGSPTSKAWNSFALYSHREDGKNKPHMTADALGLRVTKPQTPAQRTSRSYQGVKPNIGADSFHMSFLNSMKTWTRSKVWTSTSGSQEEVKEVKL